MAQRLPAAVARTVAEARQTVAAVRWNRPQVPQAVVAVASRRLPKARTREEARAPLQQAAHPAPRPTRLEAAA